MLHALPNLRAEFTHLVHNKAVQTCGKTHSVYYWKKSFSGNYHILVSPEKRCLTAVQSAGVNVQHRLIKEVEAAEIVFSGVHNQLFYLSVVIKLLLKTFRVAGGVAVFALLCKPECLGCRAYNVGMVIRVYGVNSYSSVDFKMMLVFLKKPWRAEFGKQRLRKLPRLIA